MTVIGDTYRFRWPALLLEAEVSRFVEHKESLVAELLIGVMVERDGKPGRKLLHRSSFNLMAAGTRTQLAKSLGERRDDIKWTSVLEQVCFLALERRRDGDPTIDLREVDPFSRPRWFLKPYLEYGGPTVLFAPGGSGKSYLLLAAAVTIASGRPLFGFPQAPAGPVLYLDWETDEYTHAERLRAVCQGYGLAALPPVFYRRMVGSLPETVTTVQREVARLDAVTVFVDSITPARGEGAESPDATTRLFTAFRSLVVPVFGGDHVNKAVLKGEGSGGHISPFGSIVTENRARNTWSVHRASDEGGDEMAVAFIHQKTNNGRLQKRHAYTLAFTTEVDAVGDERTVCVSIRPVDIAAVADLRSHLTLAERILAQLGDSPDGTASAGEVAEALGEPLTSVAPRLTRLKGQGRVVYLHDRKRYGLASPLEHLG